MIYVYLTKKISVKMDYFSVILPHLFKPEQYRLTPFAQLQQLHPNRMYTNIDNAPPVQVIELWNMKVQYTQGSSKGKPAHKNVNLPKLHQHKFTQI